MIGQVTICSDVLCKRITESYAFFEKNNIFFLHDKNFDISKCTYETLSMTLHRLRYILTDEYLTNLSTANNLEKNIFQYQNKSYHIDIRKETGWEGATLISLSNFINEVLALEGRIWIVNEIKFSTDWKKEILACLKFKKCTLSDLIFSVRDSWLKIGFKKKVIESDVQSGLFFLQQKGMVCKSEFDNRFELTALGYLCA